MIKIVCPIIFIFLIFVFISNEKKIAKLFVETIELIDITEDLYITRDNLMVESQTPLMNLIDGMKDIESVKSKDFSSLVAQVNSDIDANNEKIQELVYEINMKEFDIDNLNSRIKRHKILNRSLFLLNILIILCWFRIWKIIKIQKN